MSVKPIIIGVAGGTASGKTTVSDAILERVGKDRIAYMKPSSSIQKSGPFKVSTVEMKLQAISLKQLTDYLYSVETSKDMVTVKRASFVKKAGGPAAIDAVLQVETVDI